MIGILIATYSSHDKILCRTVPMAAGAGLAVLAYDDKEFGQKQSVPSTVEILLAKRKWGWQVGERRNIIRGARRLKELGCAHMLKLSGDGLVRNPAGVEGLVTELGEHKLVCSPWGHEQECIGTMVFFGDTDAILTIAEKADIGESNKSHIERLYGEAAKELGIKWKTMPMAWWEEKIGFEHLHRK